MAPDIAPPFLQPPSASHPRPSPPPLNTRKVAETTNATEGPEPSKATRKRSWKEFSAAGEFEIRPTRRDAGNTTSLRFAPVAVLERGDLPLSFLDIRPSLTAPSARATEVGSRFFAAYLPPLESCLRDCGSARPIVLVARQVEDGRLYAIERVKSGIYALCRIGSWVKEEDLVRRAITGSLEATGPAKSGDDLPPAKEWWKSAVLSDKVIMEPPSKRVKICMARPAPMLEKREQDLAAGATGREPAIQDTRGITSQGTEESIQPPDDIDCDTVQPQVTKESLFENLVTQYLEALYLSRAPLAFFAKGPLSRVRAAFNGTSNGLVISDLTVFLRTMLLTLPSMDKKFKEKMPAFIRDLSPLSSDDEDGRVLPEKKKKKRVKKRKLKLSKEGMYPFEDEYVKKWWKGDDEATLEQMGGHETIEKALKRRVGDLQVRETLAQIILVLEILALETLATSKPANADEKTEDAAVGKEALPTVVEAKATPKRKKKLLDLKLLLDLLVDKLTIWQSVEHEGDFLSFAHGSGQRGSQSKDWLGSFCTEVIIPFYKSRVPQEAVQIIKKFGGPGLLSPEKTRKPNPSKSNDKSKLKDSKTKPARRGVQKTASEANPKRRPMGLSRAATDTVVPGLLREASTKSSLSSIPLFPEKPKRRDSMASLKHLQARQINLSQFSATSSQSRKRKAQANDDQIKEAIAAIKKPNRGLAGREVAEEREKRGTAPKKNARSSATAAKPDRKALHTVPNVQVLATPHHGRRTDVFAQPVHMPQLQASPEIDVIPSSGVRPAPRAVVPGTIVKRSISLPSSHFVTETPSRGPTKTVLFESIVKKSASSSILDSAIANRTTTDMESGAVAQTPSKGPSKPFSLTGGATKRTGARPASRGAVSTAVPTTPLKHSVIPATPIKSTAAAGVRSTPVPAVAGTRRSGARAEKSRSGSIYDALGWDDDDIDELA